MIKVPIIYWGILLALFNLFGSVVARNTHAIKQRLGSLWSFILLFSVYVIGLLLMAELRIPYIAALFPFLTWGFLSFRKIFFSDEINRRMESHRRATTLSIESFGIQLLQVLTLGSLGLYADRAGLPALYLLLAVILAVVGMGTGWMLRKSLN